VTRAEVVRPFVEEAIAGYLGIDRDALEVWDDGTIPIRAGSTAVSVRLVDAPGDRSILQVLAPLGHGMHGSPALFERLNEVNAGLTFARVFWVDDEIFLAMELLAESLDRQQIGHAVSLVSLAADHWDDVLVHEFGGETPFPADPPEDPASDAPLAASTERGPNDDAPAGYI
jgi:hypothetical protein